MLLKHFLSTSNLQSTVQKLPELGGGLGNSIASNGSILQQSPQAQGGEVACTESPSRGEAGLGPDITPQKQDLFFVSDRCLASCFLIAQPSVLAGSPHILRSVDKWPDEG